LPDTLFEEAISRSILLDLINAAQKIKKDIDVDLEKTLKLWGLPQKT